MFIITEFSKIQDILIVDGEVSFILEKKDSWYIDHLHAFELLEHTYAEVDVHLPEEVNDYYPLAAC